MSYSKSGNFLTSAWQKRWENERIFHWELLLRIESSWKICPNLNILYVLWKRSSSHVSFSSIFWKYNDNLMRTIRTKTKIKDTPRIQKHTLYALFVYKNKQKETNRFGHRPDRCHLFSVYFGCLFIIHYDWVFIHNFPHLDFGAEGWGLDTLE